MPGHEFVIEPVEGSRDPTNVPFTQQFIAEEAAQCIASSNPVAQSCLPVFLRALRQRGPFRDAAGTMSLPLRSRGGSDVWLIGASSPVEG